MGVDMADDGGIGSVAAPGVDGVLRFMSGGGP